ncbi:hypothetical protein HNQ51_002031 [Inhella inkyongensis]|uniref:Transposase n=1 Tax=Inhella inkyongensis TaxID=392593 RepID=A0A840S0V3_9BURK|nr:hypothetical protein [Inhella inkyongensis]MBB5204717.1 hypothetical protein [Inhella inkyongensis]
MSRPLRIEFPGAIYHLTSRGDRREPIFEDDGDRELLLDIVGQTLERFDAQMLAYQGLQGQGLQGLGLQGQASNLKSPPPPPKFSACPAPCASNSLAPSTT